MTMDGSLADFEISGRGGHSLFRAAGVSKQGIKVLGYLFAGYSVLHLNSVSRDGRKSAESIGRTCILSARLSSPGYHLEHLQNLVTIVVDDLNGNLAALGRVEGAALCRVQRRPRFLIDLCSESALESLVRLLRAGEVGVSDKKALAVVVSVNEPASD